MRYSIAALALAGAVMAAPQGVTSAIAPSASPPPGCSESHSGTFEITIVNVTSTPAKRDLGDLEKRQKSGVLTLTLENGVLKDQAGRTGYIAENYQWQFDAPPQTGAIYTSGFSYCSNNTLALGGSAIWYQCLSGGFYNLYDRHWAPQCSPVYFETMGGTPAAVTQSGDGQPGATTQVVASQITDGQPQGVTQISDGQVQAPTGAPVTQLSDGQPQGPPPGTPVTEKSDGQPNAPTGAPVSQISDGQPQAGTTTQAPAPVSEKPEGQPIETSQAPAPSAPAPVSEKPEGQPVESTQAPAPVTQISDGQPQAGSAAPAPSTTAAPVTQISDGQPQAPTGAPVTQISDGQPQAPTGVVSNGTVSNGTTTTQSLFTGAAAPVQLPQFAAAAIGMLGAVALL